MQSCVTFSKIKVKVWVMPRVKTGINKLNKKTGSNLVRNRTNLGFWIKARSNFSEYLWSLEYVSRVNEISLIRTFVFTLDCKFIGKVKTTIFSSLLIQNLKTLKIQLTCQILVDESKMKLIFSCTYRKAKYGCKSEKKKKWVSKKKCKGKPPRSGRRSNSIQECNPECRASAR